MYKIKFDGQVMTLSRHRKDDAGEDITDVYEYNVGTRVLVEMS